MVIDPISISGAWLEFSSSQVELQNESSINASIRGKVDVQLTG